MEHNDKQILRKVDHKPGDGNADYMFICPGCKCGHGIWTEKANSMGGVWTFNGNMAKPTFSPSLLIRHPLWTPPVTAENFEQWKQAPWPQTQVENVCHSFIRDGMIQFLPDCTHALAGKTVPMESF
jgi:hypothetical protein